jgi:hypothetical protein
MIQQGEVPDWLTNSRSLTVGQLQEQRAVVGDSNPLIWGVAFVQQSYINRCWDEPNC